MSHDFESADFDPATALAAPSVSLPCEAAEALNNLAEYEKRVVLRRTAKSTEKTTTTENTATTGLSKKKQAALRASQAPSYFNSYRPRKKVKNVLTIMEDIEGPLGRLRQCMKDRTAIKVWIRRAREMRGVCVGYLQAFDRHWNLVLKDVDESYVFPKKTKIVPEAIGTTEATETIETIETQPRSGQSKKKKGPELRQRHVNQIFIRGDNVAFISIVNP